MRRLSNVLFSFLQTVSTSPGTDRLVSHKTSIGEMHRGDVAAALNLRHDFFKLPDELKLVPDRLTHSETIRAAGFSDSTSCSVGVDIACWSRPCTPELDEIGWRRVFTWIVGTDSNLSNVSIIEPPVEADGMMAGTYGYDADGIPGYGVLQVAKSNDGYWQICDCWGDAAEADRVDDLVSRIRSR